VLHLGDLFCIALRYSFLDCMAVISLFCIVSLLSFVEHCYLFCFVFSFASWCVAFDLQMPQLKLRMHNHQLSIADGDGGALETIFPTYNCHMCRSDVVAGAIDCRIDTLIVFCSPLTTGVDKYAIEHMISSKKFCRSHCKNRLRSLHPTRRKKLSRSITSAVADIAGAPFKKNHFIFLHPTCHKKLSRSPHKYQCKFFIPIHCRSHPNNHHKKISCTYRIQSISRTLARVIKESQNPTSDRHKNLGRSYCMNRREFLF